MILVERYLLPPGRTEEERLAIVREQVRKRRGANGRVIAVFPGEDGWVRQLSNKDGIVYFGVVERHCSPSLPRRVGGESSGEISTHALELFAVTGHIIPRPARRELTL